MSVGRFKLCFVSVVTGASKARTTPSKALYPGRRGISQLESLADSSRELVVVNAYESARGYLLFRQGDLPAPTTNWPRILTRRLPFSSLPWSRKNSEIPLRRS